MPHKKYRQQLSDSTHFEDLSSSPQNGSAYKNSGVKNPGLTEIKTGKPNESAVQQDSAVIDRFLYPSHYFKITSSIMTWLAVNILRVHNKLYFGLKVTGKKHIKGLKGKSSVTVCNHVLGLDCTFVACQFKPGKLKFTSLQSNLDRGFIGLLIRYLGSFPIPCSLADSMVFSRRVSEFLDRGISVHFFPEGHLIKYDKHLREFNRGAYWYAYNNNVPVVPMVISYRKARGLRRLFRQKPSINLDIFEPLYPDITKPRKEEAERLLTVSKELMRSKLEENNKNFLC